MSLSNTLRGWKHKLGVVTLGVACLFMAGWLRSLAIVDGITVWSGNSGGNSVVSADSGLFWSSLVLSDDPMPLVFMSQDLWTSWEFSASDPVEPFAHLPLIYEFCGFVYGKGEVAPGITSAVLRIPYWSIVFPLAVLSAWLLLSPSKKHELNSISLGRDRI